MRTSKNTDTAVEGIAVECPAVKGLLRIEDCISCPYHKGMENEERKKIGRGGEVEKDEPINLIVCNLPVRKRTFKIFKLIDKEK